MLPFKSSWTKFYDLKFKNKQLIDNEHELKQLLTSKSEIVLIANDNSSVLLKLKTITKRILNEEEQSLKV